MQVYSWKHFNPIPVGTALLWTLETGLDEAFSLEVREAWASAYTLLATAMQDAAAEAETVDMLPALQPV